SSRVLPESLGGYTLGVLVQTNFGGVLTMNGAPVGRELGRFAFESVLVDAAAGEGEAPEGSIMIVVATDAPIYARNLERLAMRSIMGLARTGSYAGNGSGDYVIAFSTDPDLRTPRESRHPVRAETLANEAMSPLFAAAAEATEEAIYNALLKATTVESSRGTLSAIPIESVVEVLEKYNALDWDESLPP
ncbi:MAG TPA: P1 family peptidase, partial [Woeseiaceae bacterium]|nr:P1 family peptidase [Woeseiaceae bacterium]